MNSSSLLALVSGIGARTYSVTLGTQSSQVGYSNLNGGWGSIAPNDTLQGLIIDRWTVDQAIVDHDLELNLSGFNAGQLGVFRSLLIQDGSGTFRTFNAADAVYDTNNTWTWGDGSNRLWVAGDVGEIKTAIFIL